MRSRIAVICKQCGISFYRWGGQIHAEFCSRKCACNSRRTKEFQSRAGKAGGAVKIKLRGTGRKDTYVKYFGRHEHRVVMEKFLDRELKRNEIIHHIDGDTHNNNLENLKLLTRAEHFNLHIRGKI